MLRLLINNPFYSELIILSLAGILTQDLSSTSRMLTIKIWWLDKLNTISVSYSDSLQFYVGWSLFQYSAQFIILACFIFYYFFL